MINQHEIWNDEGYVPVLHDVKRAWIESWPANCSRHFPPLHLWPQKWPITLLAAAAGA